MSRARVYYICSLSNKQRCAFVFLGVGLGSWPCLHVAGGELIIIEQAIHNIILAVAMSSGVRTPPVPLLPDRRIKYS